MKPIFAFLMTLLIMGSGWATPVMADHPAFLEAREMMDQIVSANQRGDASRASALSIAAREKLRLVSDWGAARSISPQVIEWRETARHLLSENPDGIVIPHPGCDPAAPTPWGAAWDRALDKYTMGKLSFDIAETNWEPVSCGLALVAALSHFRQSAKAAERARQIFKKWGKRMDSGDIGARFPAFYAVPREAKGPLSLQEIARLPLVYDDPAQWRLLLKANRALLKDPSGADSILPGMYLFIPSLVGEDRSGEYHACVIPDRKGIANDSR